MNYCQRCILPDTRPNLVLDRQGVCNACLQHESKASIDWGQRARAFTRVSERAKSRSAGYDCLIPVSGGKDSTWQVLTCLEQGLNPLAVTWKTPGRTPVGQKNLDNLVSLGVDHIDYQVSPKTERKFMLAGLGRHGSPAIPMHMALFNIPLTLACRYRIPLVVWGENSAFEYGSAKEEDTGFQLTSAWLERYGVTHGTTADDWVSPDLTAAELTPYFGPSDHELQTAGVTAVFLGYYFAWDPARSLEVAERHGFSPRPAGPKTGLYDYADIDDDFISVHHYLKWYKFGFSRLFDNLSLEIRNKRLSRDEAIDCVRERGDPTPHEDIGALCQYLAISKDRFFSIAEQFRNHQIWRLEGQVWRMDNFLVSDWSWT